LAGRRGISWAEMSVMPKDDFVPFIGFFENEILPLVTPTEHIDYRGLMPLHFGLFMHEGLFLPYCVFCNAAPVEVAGLGCPLLTCVFSAFQLAEKQPKKRN
jgi:hypothetical protein